MEFFTRNKNNQIMAEGIPVTELANKYGSPLYVYSEGAFRSQYAAYEAGAVNFPHLLCFAVKANSNLSILSLMAKLGSGFDIVSGGELARVIKAGGDPHKVVYSGVAKTKEEIEFALKEGIFCFNVESEAEMERINDVAMSMGTNAPVSIRVNPDVDAGTHPYISTGLKTNKFGVPIERAFNLYKHAATLKGIKITGMDCHIGSQLTSMVPFEAALDRLLVLMDQLIAEGITFEHLDMGGGLGVIYKDEIPPSPAEYIKAIINKLGNRKLSLIFEPGRSMTANSGILIAKCEYIKKGELFDFCIVDTAMNDMIRPALYQAWMNIEEADRNLDRPLETYNVVGPICESGDFLGKDRKLKVKSGDYLVMFGAGAYGFSMASNYNSRPRCAEIMVSGTHDVLIRNRETYTDLWRNENIILPSECNK